MTSFPTNPSLGQLTPDNLYQWTGFGWARYKGPAFGSLQGDLSANGHLISWTTSLDELTTGYDASLNAFEIEQTFATVNDVRMVAYLERLITGSVPAQVGIGVGLGLRTQVISGILTGSEIVSVATSVTAGVECFDLVLRSMLNGALVDVGRFSSAGNLTLTQAPLALNQGGTGARTASAARTALGSTTVGDALFTAASVAAAQGTLGATSLGIQIFQAANPAAVFSALNFTTATSVFVNIMDFGAVGNGVSDDTAAFTAFNTYAVGLGPNVAITLECPFGKTFMIGNPAWPLNIKNLTVNGRGSKFQNNTNVDVDKMLLLPATGTTQFALGHFYVPVHRYFINTVAVGASSVTTISAGDAGNFSVGEMVMVASFDVQFGGQPPNYRYFEYLVIQSINPSTGVITFTGNVKYPHRADYPYIPSSVSEGRASIYKIEQGSLFNIEHTYNDMVFAKNVVPSAAASEAVFAMGYKLTFNRCTAPYFLPTTAGYVTYNSCHQTEAGEFDKLICVVELNRCQFDGQITSATSVDVVRAKDTKFLASYSMCPKKLKLEDCDVFGIPHLFGADGHVADLEILGGSHAALPGIDTNNGQSTSVTINGSSVVWAAPVLTLDLTIAKNQGFCAQAFVGRKIFITAFTNGQDCPTGITGTITAITGGNSTASITVHFDAALGGSEQLTLYAEPDRTIIQNVNVAGVDTSQSFTQIITKNVRYSLQPVPSSFAVNNVIATGTFTRVVIDVIRAYTGATGGNICLQLISTRPSFGYLTLNVDLKTAGRREATVLGYAGWTGAAGESAGAVLPAGQLKNTLIGNYAISAPAMASTNDAQLPIVNVYIEVDGPYRTAS